MAAAASEHLHRLTATWQVLSDLCFADLLLYVHADGAEGAFTVLAHVRPATSQTLYPDDLVGTSVSAEQRPGVERAFATGEIGDEDTSMLRGAEPIRASCIPVVSRGEVVAVLTRERGRAPGRRTGELERQYLVVFERFAEMIHAGTFPFAHDKTEHDEAPRVADGVLLLDDGLRVRFASPNAMSSLHRMGIYTSTLGHRLTDAGFDDDAAEVAARLRVPVTEEVERGETSVLVQATPLLAGDAVSGVLVLVRDVTDLRRRDRILVSKDATIREIQHRVKNNLQTIAALLRVQGRRVRSREAQEAIAGSERRIRSIAVVHETLSRDVRDVVPFGEVLAPLVRIVEEAVASDELRLRVDVDGDAGDLPGEIATPLAVVLNELLQNAVEHAFPHGPDEVARGRVAIRFTRTEEELVVEVEDDGAGLPEGFSLDASRGLGLSIVQTLVTSELSGSLSLNSEGAGTQANVRVPLRKR